MGINLEILVVAARLACVIPPLAPKPTVAHNSNVFATQTTAELQSLKTVPLNSDASLKKSQSLLISTVTTICVAVMTTFVLTNQNSVQPPQSVMDHAPF